MKRISTLLRLAASDKQWVTISNLLTIARLVLAPVVVASLYCQQWLLAFVVFVVAATTDLLDGYLARALNQQTHLGTLLDPIADKVLLVASFGALAFFRSPFFHIPCWFFALVLCREALILLGSIVLLHFYRSAHVQPMIWGKLTTLSQVLFVIWIFVCYFAGWKPQRTDSVLLIILALFSCISLVQYVRRALSDVRQ